MEESPTASRTVDIFLHIPKTAGETLTTILWRQYGEQGLLEVPDPYLIADHEMLGTFESDKRLVASNPSQFGLVFGHMPFGIHEAIARPVRYFTIVRDPVDRVVSHFYYVKRESRHRLHKEVSENQMTLHDYVASGIAGELENGQTALLAGLERGAPSGDASILRRALANVDAHFVAVGLTEDFDRSLVLLKLALGWDKPVVYETANVTVGRPSVSDIEQKTIEKIKAQNLLDEALYLAIRQRLEAQIEDAGGAMKRMLWQLRLGNTLYRHYRRAQRRLLHVGRA